MPNPNWKPGMSRREKTLGDQWTGGEAVHAWWIPLGGYAKQVVLISIASNSKGQNNADSLWWSSPQLIKDPKQAAMYEVIGEDGKRTAEE